MTAGVGIEVLGGLKVEMRDRIEKEQRHIRRMQAHGGSGGGGGCDDVLRYVSRRWWKLAWTANGPNPNLNVYMQRKQIKVKYRYVVGEFKAEGN